MCNTAFSSLSLVVSRRRACICRSLSTVTFPWSRAIRNSLHLLWLTNGSWKVWRGWLAVILVLSLCRRWNAGCDRLSEVTQYGPVESASGSVGQDGPRFTAKAFD